MPTFQNIKGTIYYQDLGNQRGTPIIFIHGFACDQSEWDSQRATLLNKGFRVITYDLRGFGESSTPEGAYAHYDDLHALLKHIEVEKPYIVGHSYGGQVAIDYAEVYPDEVKRLTLIAPSLRGFKPENADSDPFPRWKKLIREGKETVVKSEIENHPSVQALRDEGDTETYSRVRDMASRYSLWHLRNNDPEVRPYDDARYKENLRKIRCPVNIIVGEGDTLQSHEVCNEINNELSEDIPREFKVLSDTGHFLTQEASDELSKMLIDQKKEDENRGEDNSITHISIASILL